MGLLSKIGGTILKPLSGAKDMLFGGGGKGGIFGTGGYKMQQDPALQGAIRELLPMLKARATGQAPSVASMQTGDAMRKLASRQAGTIKGMGGLSPALAQRLAQREGTRIGAEIAQKGGELRLKEQQGAERTLADVALGGQGRETEREGVKLGAHKQKTDIRQKHFKALGEAGTSIGKAMMGVPAT